MRKIINPYARPGNTDYQCFGCSPNNEIGLHLEFREEDDYLVANWTPRKALEGYRNVLHGGIQATLLDEIASWVVQTRCKTVGVTSSMEIFFRLPVLIEDGEITIRGRVKEVGTRVAVIETELLGHDGKVCANATVKYFLFNPAKASTDYFYPGADAF